MLNECMSLLTPGEVAVRLRIPLSTLYAWRQKQVGPRAIRVGRHLRYAERDVEGWIASLAADDHASGDGVEGEVEA